MGMANKKILTDDLIALMNNKTLGQKAKQDRSDYETLCRLANTYPMPFSVDWYFHFNKLKKKLKK